MTAKVSWCQEWMTRSGEAMNLAKQMQLGGFQSLLGELKGQFQAVSMTFRTFGNLLDGS